MIKNPARVAALAVGAMFAMGLAGPCVAASVPSTKLVSCGEQTCLHVTGQRESSAAEVRINGHPVNVQGKRHWRVNVPVSTIREWSAPFARKIEVSTHDQLMHDVAMRHEVLPTGLLGHVPNLASLVITLN